MSLQPCATGRSILGGPFVITVTPHAEPQTPMLFRMGLFDAVLRDWIGTDADNAVSCVDYLHERDDMMLLAWLNNEDAAEFASWDERDDWEPLIEAGRDFTDWRG